MRILFVHQNFPAQYRHLVKHCSGLPGWEAACIGESANLMRWPGVKGVRIHGYSLPPDKKSDLHPYLAGQDENVRRGQAVARTALEIKKSGFEPDLICVHSGWGEGLYLKDIFPDARVLVFCEFYYNAEGSDVTFETRGDPLPLDKRLLTRTRNMTQLLSMAGSDWGISPTHWQRAQYPAMIRERVSVIHDGIDTDLVRPDPAARCTLATGARLKAGDEVVTFVNRNLEPYRGFHIFARALPLIQKLRPRAHVVIIGEDCVSYGAPPPKGTTYREMFMKEVRDKLDMSKVHFLGRVPYEHFLTILRVSAAHVYLTYPFVLSWSMLEAMAAGCLVIGSRTPPVQEVLQHERNGLLVDFFSPDEVARAVDRTLSSPDRLRGLRQAARETVVENYDLRTVCLPRQMNLIESLARGETQKNS